MPQQAATPRDPYKRAAPDPLTMTSASFYITSLHGGFHGQEDDNDINLPRPTQFLYYRVSGAILVPNLKVKAGERKHSSPRSISRFTRRTEDHIQMRTAVNCTASAQKALSLGLMGDVVSWQVSNNSTSPCSRLSITACSSPVLRRPDPGRCQRPRPFGVSARNQRLAPAIRNQAQKLQAKCVGPFPDACRYIRLQECDTDPSPTLSDTGAVLAPNHFIT
ncbi:hypothetical protein Bbelb_059070 [Branchiostoma belcheri]|nr:hypothetical protein Bbelb_059070 [Branchiostoma belcheri]